MAQAKKRLGRGLGSLIAGGASSKKEESKVVAKKKSAAAPAPAAAEVPADGKAAFKEIAVAQVVPSPYQARKEFVESDIAELAESIRAEGLIQPIVVRAVGKDFELVAGERRWRAFNFLKLRVIPAHVIDVNDESSAALGLIENLQRADLDPIEQARGYQSLLQEFSLTQEALAERLGKKRVSIANVLRLLTLSSEVQAYVKKGLISTGHAKVLLSIGDRAEQAVAARLIIEKGMSVRDTERFVAGNASSVASRKDATRLSDRETGVISDLEKKLSSHLKTSVQVKHSPKKGKIVLEYFGNEDLQRLLEILGLE